MTGFFAEYEHWMDEPRSTGLWLLAGSTVGLPLVIAMLYQISGVSAEELLVLLSLTAVTSYVTPIAGFAAVRSTRGDSQTE